MRSSTLVWARSKLREEAGAFADDPHGYCGGDITTGQAWDQLVSLGEDLMVDPVAVVLEDCSPHEIKRLEELIGRNFG